MSAAGLPTLAQLLAWRGWLDDAVDGKDPADAVGRAMLEWVEESIAARRTCGARGGGPPCR